MKTIIVLLVAMGMGTAWADGVLTTQTQVKLPMANEEEWTLRGLSARNAWFEITVVPECGGRILEWADRKGGFSPIARPRKLEESAFSVKADGLLVQDRIRRHEKSVWVGDDTAADDLRCSVGLSFAQDRAALETVAVFANGSSNAQTVAEAARWIDFPWRMNLEDPIDGLVCTNGPRGAWRVRWEPARNWGMVCVPEEGGRLAAAADLRVDPFSSRMVRRIWYPVFGLDGVCHATRDGAVSLRRTEQGDAVRFGFHSTQPRTGCVVELAQEGKTLYAEKDVSVGPGEPCCRTVKVAAEVEDESLVARLLDAEGRVVLLYSPRVNGTGTAAEVETNATSRVVASGEAGPSARAVALAAVRAACQKGDFQLALKEVDRAGARGGEDARLHVVRAIVLRKLKRLTQSSRELRMAERIDPLDPLIPVERAFLEDDGEGAFQGLSEGRGDARKSLRQVVEAYRSLGAGQEAGELERQAEQK